MTIDMTIDCSDQLIMSLWFPEALRFPPISHTGYLPPDLICLPSTHSQRGETSSLASFPCVHPSSACWPPNSLISKGLSAYCIISFPLRLPPPCSHHYRRVLELCWEPLDRSLKISAVSEPCLFHLVSFQEQLRKLLQGRVETQLSMVTDQ